MSYGTEAGRLIFVRVPRTGSTTALRRLEADWPDLERRTDKHASAAVACRAWGDAWEARHTFGDIRNPWEWLVSVYNAGISSGARGHEPWPGRRLANGTAQRANLAFDEWVRQRDTTPMDWLTGEDGTVLVDEIRRFEDVTANAPECWSAVPHAPYREWYDDDLAAYVAEKCCREIETGGYAF